MVKKQSSKSSKKSTFKLDSPGKKSDDDQDASKPNRPRNLLVIDATNPFTFSFTGRFGTIYDIKVNQTPDEDTWPGGALWDLGVLLSRVLVGLAGGKSSTSTMMQDGKMRSKTFRIELPKRVTDIDWKRVLPADQTIVVELGCGVGLTGLVAAAALSAKVCFLTDLDVVIEKVAKPNVTLNAQQANAKSSAKKMQVIRKGKARIIATPLCWGNKDDEQAVLLSCQQMETMAGTTRSGSGPKKKKKSSKLNNCDPSPPSASREVSKPDLVLIGDVAYQHKPGAPSHFDALISTLLKLVGSHTYVIFGTRVRMPASVDLLNTMLEHLQEVVEPMTADEIDPSFVGLKHNMTIHILRKRTRSIRAGSISQDLLV